MPTGGNPALQNRSYGAEEGLATRRTIAITVRSTARYADPFSLQFYGQYCLALRSDAEGVLE